MHVDPARDDADDAAPATPEPAPAAPVAPEAPAEPFEPDAVPEASAVLPEPAAPELDPVAPAFDDDGQWHRVSPKFIVVEVVGSLVALVVTVAVIALVAYFAEWRWAWWVGGAVAVVSIVSIAFEPRRVRSIGYRLRRDDLVFRRGIMFQRQVAVPYGRMQLVDLTRSPVARWLGLAELKFVTAAAATAVVVPGLPLEEAEALRDELVALAETRRAGL
ncbi:PH domain-containing protein [Agromyces seonyuensis]|uniref:PH domain-containing protein n=1 Tax=Agromyces seonyuensis TaxID=2662446 RepID=A0A6I4NXT8_9MICO|nr:PH domain-containing protein [Agromyces seonyuensis]MWB99093.1 PH domain-containing protein [Agromyces seonyuensis]